MYIYYLNTGKLLNDNQVISFDDPLYNEYRELAIEYGNEPEEPTPEEIKTLVVSAVQNHLDEISRTRGYDGILSLCTYANSTIDKFRLEGQAGVNWRDSCWSFCYQLMDDVANGRRTLPTINEVLSELPNIEW